jgi:hypothetical protein
MLRLQTLSSHIISSVSQLSISPRFLSMATNTQFNGQTTGQEVTEKFASSVKGRTCL